MSAFSLLYSIHCMAQDLLFWLFQTLCSLLLLCPDLIFANCFVFTLWMFALFFFLDWTGQIFLKVYSSNIQTYSWYASSVFGFFAKLSPVASPGQLNWLLPNSINSPNFYTLFGGRCSHCMATLKTAHPWPPVWAWQNLHLCKWIVWFQEEYILVLLHMMMNCMSVWKLFYFNIGKH